MKNLLSKLAVSIFVFVGVSVAQAAPDCSSHADRGERIKCQTDGLIEATQDSVNQAENLGVLSEEQKKNLNNSLERGRKHSARTGPKGYKGLAKKDEVSCAIKELSLQDAIDFGVTGDPKWKQGNEDGVCDKNETCEEIVGDQLGNDDGLCFPKNGKKKEECVQLCDSEAVAENDDNFDAERSDDLENTILETTEATEAANVRIAQAAEVMRVMEFLRAESEFTGPCDILPGSRTPLPDGLRYSVIAARGAANIHDKFCNQDAAGFNSASACAVIEGVLYTLEQVLAAIEDKNADVTTETIDLTRECVQQISAEVADTKAEILEVKRLVEETNRLLRTPQGQREGFPDKSDK